MSAVTHHRTFVKSSLPYRVPIAIVGPTIDGFEFIRLDGDMKHVFIDRLCEELNLTDGQREWLERSIEFKVVKSGD